MVARTAGAMDRFRIAVGVRNGQQPTYLQGAGAWVAHRAAMTSSPAWRAAPLSVRRILDRLEAEHMAHAGKMNGSLSVSYGQFVKEGVSRKDVRRALILAEQLGLLKVVRNTQKIGGQLRDPNVYRLTYLPADGRNPTDDWKRVTAQDAKAALDAYRAKGRARNGTSRKKDPQ